MKIAIATLLLTLVFGSSAYSQEPEFEYDENILTKYAILAMEEYNNKNSRQRRDIVNEFDIENPVTFGRTLKDCEGNPTNVVVVAFNDLKGSGCAAVYMNYNKDNYFSNFLNRAYVYESAEKTVTGFINNDLSDFLFGCGF